MLEIVQNEEYLAAAELNILKRRIGAILSATLKRNESQTASIPSVKYEGTKKTFGLIGSTQLRPRRQAPEGRPATTTTTTPATTTYTPTVEEILRNDR